MIYDLKMFGAKCDHCGKEFRDDHSGFDVMPDEQSIKETIMNHGWHEEKNQLVMSKGTATNKDVHYCPDCFYFDENGKLKLRDKDVQAV